MERFLVCSSASFVISCAVRNLPWARSGSFSTRASWSWRLWWATPIEWATRSCSSRLILSRSAASALARLQGAKALARPLGTLHFRNVQHDAEHPRRRARFVRVDTALQVDPAYAARCGDAELQIVRCAGGQRARHLAELGGLGVLYDDRAPGLTDGARALGAIRARAAEHDGDEGLPVDPCRGLHE